MGDFLRRILSLLLAAGLLAGCAHFESQPISPDRTANELEGRSLGDPGLRKFIEQGRQRELAEWPPKAWDLELLTFAALYFHPSLEVARAQWAVARGGQATAAQRPNPTLNVTPGYNATTTTPTPWLPLGWVDFTIETAGKRGYRRAQAAQLSEAARLNIATVAWQLRSDLRSNLVDFLAAGRRETLLGNQISIQQQMVRVLEQQVQAGAAADADAGPSRIALAKARVDLAEAQRQRAEARSHLAESLGVPLRALDEVQFAPELPPPAGDLTAADLRRLALLGRPDILSALAEYAAAQSALRLEIAKQYPDVHLQPGYEFDQGDSKWSLGATIELPVLNQNQGPIAEAEARRREIAARFNALQAKILAEIDRATTAFRLTQTNAAGLRALAQTQAKRTESVTAQFRAGAAERLDLLNAELESATAELLQLEGSVRLQQAAGALENALQRPLDLPANVLEIKPAP